MTSDGKAYQAVLATPFGALGILMQGEKLRRIDLLFGGWESKGGLDHRADRLARMIAAYLRDPTVTLEPVIDTGGTPFQQRVWRRLRCIPLGSVLTYGHIARELHTSPRAVGNACRANPCPLVVPCHRVVGARGLGGFAGQQGGEKLAVKRWLLTHEGVPLEQEWAVLSAVRKTSPANR